MKCPFLITYFMKKQQLLLICFVLFSPLVIMAQDEDSSSFVRYTYSIVKPLVMNIDTVGKKKPKDYEILNTYLQFKYMDSITIIRKVYIKDEKALIVESYSNNTGPFSKLLKGEQSIYIEGGDNPRAYLYKVNGVVVNTTLTIDYDPVDICGDSSNVFGHKCKCAIIKKSKTKIRYWEGFDVTTGFFLEGLPYLVTAASFTDGTHLKLIEMSDLDGEVPSDLFPELKATNKQASRSIKDCLGNIPTK